MYGVLSQLVIKIIKRIKMSILCSLLFKTCLFSCVGRSFLYSLFVCLFLVVVANENAETLSNGQTSENLPQNYDSNNSQCQTPVPPPRKVSVHKLKFIWQLISNGHCY